MSTISSRAATQSRNRPQESPTNSPIPSEDRPTSLVTGSSRGIGRRIALSLAQAGANVVVNYFSSPQQAEQVVEEIADHPGTALACEADVSNPDEVESMAERIHDEFGPIDVLVNNAGITVNKKFGDTTYEDWRRVMDVNLGGVFHCTKRFFEDLCQSDRGRLINVSSVIGQRGNYGQVNYAASKSALFGFTRSLAREFAPCETTANCVAPGFTETDMIEGVRDDIQDHLREQIPLGRFARPKEVADLVGFLASQQASYITGQVIGVNGGMWM